MHRHSVVLQGSLAVEEVSWQVASGEYTHKRATLPACSMDLLPCTTPGGTILWFPQPASHLTKEPRAGDHPLQLLLLLAWNSKSYRLQVLPTPFYRGLLNRVSYCLTYGL